MGGPKGWGPKKKVANVEIYVIFEVFAFCGGRTKTDFMDRGYWSQSALAQSPFAGTPCVWRLIFWAFLTKTKRRIKPSQVMSIEKFSPIALNFGYDFVLLVHFFGTPCSNVVGRITTTATRRNDIFKL